MRQTFPDPKLDSGMMKLQIIVIIQIQNAPPSQEQSQKEF